MKSLMRTRYHLVVIAVLAILILPLLVAAVFLQEIPEQVLVWATLILSLLLGILAPRPLDWIKNVLGLTGLAAFRLILGISLVIAVACMVLAGYFAGFEASPEAILAAFGVFLGTVTYVYKALNPRPQSP